MKMAKLFLQKVPFPENDSFVLSADILKHATIFIIKCWTSSRAD